MAVNLTIKQLRKTAAQWTSDNTILADGVLGFETDTGKYKIGDGATAWNSLSYPSFGGGGTWGSITGTLSDQTDLQTALDAKITANSPITGATKTKVTYDANGLITSGADATTADIADSLDKRYITDAQQTILGNTSGTNTGDETTATIKTKLGAASSLQDGYLTSTDWTTFNSKQAALGFTPEDVANKSTSTSLGTSDTLYPSQNAVKTYVDTGLATKYDASNPSGYITGIAWGAITGTLSSQTDLQSALDAKANLSGAAFTGDVSVTTSGSGDTLQLTNSGSGTTLNILNSGSGDLFKIDTNKLVVDNGGDVSIGTSAASARFHVLTGSTSKIGAIIQAAAGQTANTFEIRDSSGNIELSHLIGNGLFVQNYSSGSTIFNGNARGSGTVAFELQCLSSRRFRVLANATSTTFESSNQSGGFIFNKAITPASLADASAQNNSIYYSTDASKLVYKDSSGTSNNLYDDGLIDINTQTASYTLVLADANKLVRMNVASANNLTIPPNSSVAFGVGTVLYVEQMGAGTTTVVAGSGVTINTTALKTPYQYGTITLIQVSADVWNVLGGTV